MPPKKAPKLTAEQQALLNARKAEAAAGAPSGPSKEELKAKREAAKAALEARKAAEEAEKDAALALELAEKLKIAERYAETAASRSEAAAKKAAEEAEEARQAAANRFEKEAALAKKIKAARKEAERAEKNKGSVIHMIRKGMDGGSRRHRRGISRRTRRR
jgi:hypothetical protein